MDGSTITATSFTLMCSTGTVSGTVSYTNKVTTLKPSAVLSAGTGYTATVTTAATDVAGNHLAHDYSFSFTTAGVMDITHPSVVSMSPVSGTLDVELTATITITFSEPIKKSSVTASSFIVTRSGVAITGDITFNETATTATFTPSTSLAIYTGYQVALKSTITDLAGLTLTVWGTSFTTRDGTWGAAQPIGMGTGSQGPNVAFNGAGTSMAVWTQFNATDSDYDTCLCQFSETSGALNVLSGNGNNGYSMPVISSSLNGSFMAAWQEKFTFEAASYTKIFAAKITPGAPMPIGQRVTVDGATNETFPSISCVPGTAGKTFLAWNEYSGGLYTPYGAVYDVTWGASGTLSGSLSSDNTPDVAADLSGNAFAVWIDAAGGNPMANRYSASAWQATPTTLALEAANTVQVACDPSGNAIAVWDLSAGTNIKASRFTSGAWSPLVDNVSGSVSGAYSPQVAFDGAGNAMAVWIQGSAIYENHFSTNTYTWLSAGKLDDAVTPAGPQVAMDAFGNGIVAWLEDDSRKLKIKRYRTGTGWMGTLSLDIVVSTSSSNPSISVEPNSGKAAVVWEDNGVIKAAIFR